MVKSTCLKKMFCGCMPLLWALLLGGCTERTHFVDYYDPVFIDSTTIGAIRVEYDQDYWPGVVSPEYKTYNISFWFDFCTLEPSRIKKTILIRKKLRPHPRWAKFVYPYLLYHIEHGNNTYIEMLDIETEKKWVLTKNNGFYPKGISTKGTYAIIDDKIVRRDDGSLFLQLYNNELPVYFDEDSSILISRKSGHYLKTYIDIDKIDTLGTDSQIGALRMVANNRFAIVNAVDTSEATGLPFVASGLINVENLMAGRFQTEPLKSRIREAECLPNKNLCVFVINGVVYGPMDNNTYITTAMKSYWKEY